MNASHAVVGAGPLGTAVVEELLAKGARVILISRSSRMGERKGLEQITCDATDAGALTEALKGADIIYHCANAPYHRWPQQLPPIWDGVLEATAAVAGRKLVVGTNLYAYGRPRDGQPLTAHSEINPCTRKGRVRAAVERKAMEFHRQGAVRAALVRASDFYGPGVRDSVLGEQFFAAARAGKPATLFGAADAPHSYAYLPDFAKTMAAVGLDAGDDVWGRSWIVPNDGPVTARELEAIMRRIEPRFSVKFMSRAMLRFGGLFVPMAREMVEMLYEFEQQFVADGSETEARFGIAPTGLASGLRTAYERARPAPEHAVQ